MTATTAAEGVNTSIRLHPDLVELFKTAESRYMTEPELARYCEVVPEHRDRTEVSRAMAQIDTLIVKRTVNEVFIYYPFKDYHENSMEKCIRDVGYVSAYVTLAMLMNDIKWLDDKFLLWMRTMVQAFNFPAQVEPKQTRSLLDFRPKNASTTTATIFEKAKRLPQSSSAIFATYSALALNFRYDLKPDHWQLVQPYFKQAIDTLSAE